MTTLFTTPRLLKLAGACGQEPGCGVGYDKAVTWLRQGLPCGPNDRWDLITVLDSNGLEDALWSLRAVLPEQVAVRDRLARLYACRCAEDVAHLWIAPSGVTWRPMDTIEVARRYANGQASDRELELARMAAAEMSEGAAEAAGASAWSSASEAAGASEGAAEMAAEMAAELVEGSPPWAWASARAAAKYTLWFREMFGPEEWQERGGGQP